MKTFYNVGNTDYSLDVQLDITPICDNGCPVSEVVVNNQVLYSSQCVSPISLQCQVPLLQPFLVIISLKDKVYDADRETALIVDRLKIDDYDLIPRFNHLVEYNNEKNIEVKSNYLGYNGSWCMNFGVPFYNWIHIAEHRGFLLYPTLD